MKSRRLATFFKRVYRLTRIHSFLRCFVRIRAILRAKLEATFLGRMRLADCIEGRRISAVVATGNLYDAVLSAWPVGLAPAVGYVARLAAAKHTCTVGEEYLL